jgi:hypothetical protein
MERRLERQARNEALLREVNERIEQVDKAEDKRSPGAEPGLFEFICECGQIDRQCKAHVEMTIEEYERVRSEDDRFAVFPGHEDDQLETVVERTERFAVVDKRPAAEPLVADDPRGASSR